MPAYYAITYIENKEKKTEKHSNDFKTNKSTTISSAA